LFGYLSQVYITAGMVSDKDFATESVAELHQIHNVNFAGLTYLLAPFCQQLCNIKSNITVISTIAAIRPRSRNLAYGSAKIALEYFIGGLQHFYADKPMRLQIYRVGYMQTAMSAGKKLLLPVADPNKVAHYIFEKRNKHFRMHYYPRFWALIAIPLKLLPWLVYKKLKH
jgi:short-subunit dehydrogenase